MFARSAMKTFDVMKDLQLGWATCIEKPLLHALAFERVDKRLPGACKYFSTL